MSRGCMESGDDQNNYYALRHHGTENMKLLKKGKVKEVYEAGGDALEFRFTDQISVFDKIIPTMVPHKGETLCRTSEFWFSQAKSLGIGTHYLKRTAPDRMLVKKVDIIYDYSKISGSTKNYLIPLEVICRHYVSGSLFDRLKAGQADWKTLGFGRMPAYGEKLPEPMFEVTTKLEEIDRKLDETEALMISGLSRKEYDNIRETVLKIDGQIAREVEKRGLIHVDGKKEFAFDADRKLMVIDTYGTADEDRFWDRLEYDSGRCVELSKEFVRQYYRGTGYYDRLIEARGKATKEPDIPELPAKTVKEVSELYIGLFERLTGGKFR